MRIGDVALDAIDNERAGQRAAASDLDAVAELLDIARLAQHAMIEFFAARRRPLQKFYSAVDGDVFLIAGDQERDRSFRRATIGGQIIERRRDAAGNAALHVDRAAAVEKAVFDLAGEGAVTPRALVARRHHIGVTGEGKMRRGAADAGVEIFDVRDTRLAEGDAVHVEAGILQQILEHAAPAAAGVTDGQRTRSRAMARAFGSISAGVRIPAWPADRGRTG